MCKKKCLGAEVPECQSAKVKKTGPFRNRHDEPIASMGKIGIYPEVNDIRESVDVMNITGRDVLYVTLHFFSIM